MSALTNSSSVPLAQENLITVGALHAMYYQRPRIPRSPIQAFVASSQICMPWPHVGPSCGGIVAPRKKNLNRGKIRLTRYVRDSP